MSKKLLALAGIAVAIVLAGFMATPRGSEATVWSPFFGPTDFYRLSSTAISPNASPGAGIYPDTHAQYNVFEPSANFTALFGGAMTLGGGTDPTNDVLNASAAGIPNTGALIGSLTAGSILGLLGEGCNSPVPVTFRFVESNVDNTLALPMGVASPATPSAITLAANVTAASQTIPYLGADLLGTKSGVTEGTAADPNHPDAAVNEIRIDGEDMLVTGVNEAANEFYVIRGWNSTAAPITHTSGAGIDRVNVIYPNGPPANLLANLAEDDGNIDNAGGVEHPFLLNNISDGADEVPAFVRNSQDPNGDPSDGGAIQSSARYAGNAFVANSLIVILQFSVLAPGVLPANNVPNLQWVTNDWGYQSVTYLQDPLAPPSNSAITDFCNFSSQTFFYGIPHDNECTATPEPAICNVPGGGFILQDSAEPTGVVCQDGSPTTPNECGTACAPSCSAPCDSSACWRARNPTSASMVRYYQYGVSQRDYDNDGHENALDVCASDPNPNWNPRANNAQPGQDSDGDGLPDACDTTPAVPGNDADTDTWLNRLDNCPNNANTVAPAGGGGSIPNTYQFDLDLGAPFTNVPDGGPRNDSIGPGSANTGDSGCDVPANNCTDPFPACGPLSPTGPNGHYHATAAAQTICIGAVADSTPCDDVLDGDNDGVRNAGDTCILGPNAPAPFQGPSAQDTLAAPAGIGANSVTVGSVAGFVNGQPIVIDTAANRETLRYITGINTTTNVITFADQPGPPAFDQSLAKAHATGANVAQVAFAQALRDFNNDGFADGTDITILSGSFGKLGGDPSRPAGYQARLDLNSTGSGPDSVNDGTDITLESGSFGKKCGPTPSGGF